MTGPYASNPYASNPFGVIYKHHNEGLLQPLKLTGIPSE